MSEYQHYDFLAIDRPLGDDEQAEVRSLSTRARMTTTSFANDYHWGNFRGDPNRALGAWSARVSLPPWFQQCDVTSGGCGPQPLRP
ncbi:hypothetical protein [Pseudonocardia kunmingensis]|uniref:Uncharacterized protein n=1 Tax=Pseudonocardia kunmingensis TaxID=630975 RepID=A0A543DKU1_9PSEU|nr:hypothetical protein [Pseudonocardia kunmingensis]TQM09954.1 hypothetical protein FB558_5732 [Pseudonocardia kunmingensis]